MKYILLSIIFHILLIIPYYKHVNTLGNPDISRKISIPISYNSRNLPERIDNIKKVKGSEIKQPKVVEETNKKIEEKEIKKPQDEFKSKMKKNTEKKVEKKITENKEIKKSQNNQNKKQPHKNLVKEENKKESIDEVLTKNGNFVANSDGSYTALSAKGINFEILNQIDPNYPRQAEVIRYNKTVIVETRFLVGLDGRVEKIEILKSHEKFGFDKEVMQALKKWKFKPITYGGKKLKVYFVKEFIFKPKS
ncbi:energy transducer TonB [Fusobacterium perfoetens]|uniref:energy transducer TonB n=1 Tax=Fusobacterium perfoetens TaxID=852 RepID=UPI0004830195|nr:energy transducer TonB [Fusobacterium perfoetens]MCI6153157.1 energy transducer TonB [Fusobacterium perfoetens]MDY3237087.1 energy transducer TonB [Fusobacterium perfoetens]